MKWLERNIKQMKKNLNSERFIQLLCKMEKVGKIAKNRKWQQLLHSDCTSFSADWKHLPLEWNKNLHEKWMLFVYLSVYFLLNFQHRHRTQELKQSKAQNTSWQNSSPFSSPAVTTVFQRSLHSSFSASKRKNNTTLYLTKEEQYYSDYWKIEFVNNSEKVTVHLPSSVRGQDFDY